MTDDVRVRGRARLATPRSRGGVTGLGLLLLGIWGALIPFVGPYFDYAYTPNSDWKWTAARGVMEVLPGAVTAFAGLVLLVTGNRVTATVAGWLGVLAGAWFVIGPLIAPLYDTKYLRIGTPVGNKTDMSVEEIGIFFGLGAAIVLLAALAVGRFSVVGVRDVAHREQRERDRRRETAETTPFFGARTGPEDAAETRPIDRDTGPVARDTAPIDHESAPLAEEAVGTEGTSRLRRSRRTKSDEV